MMAGEYNSKNFNIFYKEDDIIKQTTTPHMSKYNEVDEKKN
jgi:hypothetical protein